MTSRNERPFSWTPVSPHLERLQFPSCSSPGTWSKAEASRLRDLRAWQEVGILQYVSSSNPRARGRWGFWTPGQLCLWIPLPPFAAWGFLPRPWRWDLLFERQPLDVHTIFWCNCRRGKNHHQFERRRQALDIQSIPQACSVCVLHQFWLIYPPCRLYTLFTYLKLCSRNLPQSWIQQLMIRVWMRSK